MDTKIVEMLKRDLAKAIREKNSVRIAELKELLNITDEQSKYFERGLTGYPSIDKVWANSYQEGAEEKANTIPVDKTVWDVVEEKLLEYYDIPALEYFKREFSRQEFIDLCYKWARTFRAMGVKEKEIVPVYGIFVPDICAMVFALNMIGAVPYFLKLAISDEALADETKEAKIAVVFDGMWKNVAKEFSKDRFKNVIVASVPEDMPAPLKQVVKLKDFIDARRNKAQIPDEKKYIWADKAKAIADYYTGDVKVPFVPGRTAFITSSSGTTIGGVVKGTMATNEATLSQIAMAVASETQFFPGDRVLNSLPPTASTSLNLLFIMGLYSGETVLIDPRITAKDFYRQLIDMKPNQALHTGSMWEAFFNEVEAQMRKGRRFDFSYAKGWTLGGEGTDVKKFLKWKELMRLANNDIGLISGYGLSEMFSAVCAEKIDSRYNFTKQIMSVGIPYAGIEAGIFDENGNELSYNQRGELRLRSKSAMQGYYGKPELSASKFENGWLKTGDMAEIDEDGFFYIWGRFTSTIEVNNQKIYAFDIANKIKEMSFIDDAMVLQMPIGDNENNFAAHIVWNKDVVEEDKPAYIEALNNLMIDYLPEGVTLNTYAFHDIMLPYSPTTLKKDANKMSEQTTGFCKLVDGNLVYMEYCVSQDGKHYVRELDNKKAKRLLKRI